VDGDDVPVVENGQGERLARESLAAIGIGGSVADEWFMKEEVVAPSQTHLGVGGPATTGAMGIGPWRWDLVSLLAWLAVGIPLTWGVWITLSNALVLFG
jgi:hypothetical protein